VCVKGSFVRPQPGLRAPAADAGSIRNASRDQLLD
jgi:hypothetical protein